jgi:hypothetical protein
VLHSIRNAVRTRESLVDSAVTVVVELVAELLGGLTSRERTAIAVLSPEADGTAGRLDAAWQEEEVSGLTPAASFDPSALPFVTCKPGGALLTEW